MSIPFLGLDDLSDMTNVEYAVTVVLHKQDMFVYGYNYQVISLHAYPGKWILREPPPEQRPVMLWASPADDLATEYVEKVTLKQKIM
jgi:hypothetical protein